jgi:hypothetical protein
MSENNIAPEIAERVAGELRAAIGDIAAAIDDVAGERDVAAAVAGKMIERGDKRAKQAAARLEALKQKHRACSPPRASAVRPALRPRSP